MANEVIYFVSDTHLGDGSGSDRFLYPDQLLDLLNRIEAEPGAQLVLLGDLMELWATSMEPVLIRHAPIFFKLGQLASTHSVTYVVGNHDCIPWYYFVGQGAGNIRVAERFTAARGALVAIHGHQYDPFNKVKLVEGQLKVPWTRRLVQAIGFVGRVGGHATSDTIADIGATVERAAEELETLFPEMDEKGRQSLRDMLRGTKQVLERESPGERGYPPSEHAYEDAARAFMRAGARFVVMGHTHHPLLHSYGSRVYVNSGSWVWDKYPPTYARFARGTLELLEANTHQPYRPEQDTQTRR